MAVGYPRKTAAQKEKEYIFTITGEVFSIYRNVNLTTF